MQRDAVSNSRCAVSGYVTLLHLIMCLVTEKIIADCRMATDSQQSTGFLLDYLRIAFIRFIFMTAQQIGLLEAIQSHVPNTCRDPMTLLWTYRTSQIV